jgi:hypothetical protein
MPQRLWLAILCTACAAAQTVRGTVVNAVTGSGIAGVKVDLIWSGEPAYNTTADAQGRFLFEHVQAGAYTVQYSAEGYEWIGLFSRPAEPRIYRAAAEKPVEIVARMMPMGSLSGRVVDSAGKPVPKAPVEVIGPGIQMGFSADAEGRFDFHRLTFPGAYTISAIPPPGFHAPAPAPDDDRVLAWTRTWYPGVTDPAGAGKIVLSAGASLDHIEIKLRAAPAHAIRGHLLNPDGTAAPDTALMLSSFKGAFQAKSSTDGTFEFMAVDGDWRLSSEAPADSLTSKPRASQFVTVAGRDREGVKLQLDAPISVSLHAVAETEPNTLAPKFTPRPMTLVTVDRTGMGMIGDRVLARPEPDGTFSLTGGVYPRSYEISAGEPAGYYLASVRLGETPVPGRAIDVSDGAVITLVYRADGGTVRGMVENCANGGVVLVAQDRVARRFEDVRQAECDTSDRYEFTAVRPGAYSILGLARDPSDFLWIPRWDDALAGQAAGVTVRANETLSLDLRAVSRQ